MKEVLSKLFSVLKYFLLVAALGLVLYGIMATYARLEKSLTEATEVFIPFGFVLITFLLNIIVRSKTISKNLLFNFVSCMVFSVAIIICLRSMFDKNMLLFYKYGINFNPAFFADNLSIIESMLYMIGGADIGLLLVEWLSKEKKVKEDKISVEGEHVKHDIKEEIEENDEEEVEEEEEKPLPKPKKRKRQS